jgi:hypothetical protein
LHHELERLCLYLDGREADAFGSRLSESLTMVEKGIPAFYTPRGRRARVAYRTARYGVD